MAIDLISLIKAASMDDQTRQRLLFQLKTMSEKQKEELTNMCWASLSQTYFAQLRFELDKYQQEVCKGEKKYNVKDLKEIEEKLTKEFAQKLKSAESEASIEEVREELKKYTQPDKTNPAPPPPAPPSIPPTSTSQ